MQYLSKEFLPIFDDKGDFSKSHTHSSYIIGVSKEQRSFEKEARSLMKKAYISA